MQERLLESGTELSFIPHQPPTDRGHSLRPRTPKRADESHEFSCSQHDASLPAGLHDSRPSVFLGYVQLNLVFNTNLSNLCVSLLPRSRFVQSRLFTSGVFGGHCFQLPQSQAYTLWTSWKNRVVGSSHRVSFLLAVLRTVRS